MSSGFSDQIESLFLQLEDAIDAIDSAELDADYTNEGSVLTVTVAGCHPIILNRHAPTEQLWLATKEGGYHLEYNEEAGDWLCTRSKGAFRDLWLEACQAQFGRPIDY